MIMTHQLKKKCYSKQDRSGSFMINRVKKLEFIFKTSAAHTEKNNSLVSTDYTPAKKKKTKVKFQ